MFQVVQSNGTWEDGIWKGGTLNKATGIMVVLVDMQIFTMKGFVGGTFYGHFPGGTFYDGTFYGFWHGGGTWVSGNWKGHISEIIYG